MLNLYAKAVSEAIQGKLIRGEHSQYQRPQFKAHATEPHFIAFTAETVHEKFSETIDILIAALVHF